MELAWCRQRSRNHTCSQKQMELMTASLLPLCSLSLSFSASVLPPTFLTPGSRWCNFKTTASHLPHLRAPSLLSPHPCPQLNSTKSSSHSQTSSWVGKNTQKLIRFVYGEETKVTIKHCTEIEGDWIIFCKCCPGVGLDIALSSVNKKV